jgi:hypothetical protein
MSELAKEVEDIRPDKEQEIGYVKQTNVEAKTASVIQKVLNVLPQAAETAATFTPLAPFAGNGKCNTENKKQYYLIPHVMGRR